jgi:hypothetical protein
VLRDAGSVADGGELSADPPVPCPPDFVDEGDACIAWRDVRAGDHPWAGTHRGISLDDSLPDIAHGYSPVVVALPDGSEVAVSTDLYALPIAWRTTPDGAWRETIPPPSAFISAGALLSEDEALFFGDVAFVFVRSLH